jgi:gamma-glutamyltranspeptidase/glutathione hydrolase
MSSYSTRRRFFAVIAILAFGLAPATAQDARQAYVPAPPDTVRAIAAEHGMVVAQEKISAQVGAEILRRGGNAVDAAVATGFAMAVTYPRAGNIGGGGFMVIHSTDRNEDITIDYRETAPAATTPQIFLGADGKPDPAKSRDSALGVGVPGTVAGLSLALEKYGSGQFTLAQLLEPAIVSSSATTWPIRCRAGTGGWHAGLLRPKSSRGPMARRFVKATSWCRATSRRRCPPSQHRGHAASMKGRLRKNSPRPWLMRAASWRRRI